MKKKNLFKMVLLSVLALMTFLFVGCGPQAKTFTKHEMSITLTDEFVEKTQISLTCYYESRDVIVTTVKEEFSLISGGASNTVSQYAEMVLSNNGMSGVDPTVTDDYAWFVYEKTVSGNDFSYLATCHKSGEAFWLIQFCTYTSEFEAIFLTCTSS